MGKLPKIDLDKKIVRINGESVFMDANQHPMQNS